jgi:hypothetical protein
MKMNAIGHLAKTNLNKPNMLYEFSDITGRREAVRTPADTADTRIAYSYDELGRLSGMAGSKGYLKLLVFLTLRDSFRLYLRNSARKGFLQLFYAIVYIFLPSAGYHFDGTVRHISDLAGKVISICDVIGGETKTHSLNATCKSYLFSCLTQSSSCLFIIVYFRR